MTTTTTDSDQRRTAIDPDALTELIGRIVGDLGATLGAGCAFLGDRLGLYRALADHAPVTADELAGHTGTDARYVRPWLAQQAAGGYVEYDAEAGTWSMTPEQVATLADSDGPAFFAGAMQLVVATLRDVPAIEQRFRSGQGFGWHEHDADLFTGTERFFRPGYLANLLSDWLPALDGVTDRLQRGARVLDVGCGHGASTVLMARAFPASTFVGVDYHEASITVARRRAEEAGVSDRVTFEVADAGHLPPGSVDLVTMFDCLHDMGDPEAAARAARGVLTDDGTLMVVEPLAGDSLEDNLHPLGRVFYGASTLICTPASLAQPGARALGTQAGPTRMLRVLTDGGFRRARVATTGPVNLVLEARA